ncbi:hypothetical protein OG618_37580 (plasmid) [Kitasatospora sp. NBC_01246]|uniref:hypothetical protein n=1 Tax=Kitasatospora sp. NBC_01246 TaxID=2903570 RepID=UPI002E34101C|nr:hypothetical protein [Kitasatospora sp. NBC_01246]
MHQAITVTRITPRGFTGEEPKPEYTGDGEDRLAWLAARYYNTLAPRSAEGDKLAAVYEAAQAEADQLWAALASTRTDDWAAAHHRWVLAEDAAAEAGEELVDADRHHDWAEDRLTLGDRAHYFLSDVIAETPGARWPYGPGGGSTVRAAQDQRAKRESAAAKTLAVLAP